MIKPHICVLTGGHLSTCPRMLKAADAFHDAGYRVTMVSSRFMGWAWDADLELRRTRAWEWRVIDQSPRSGTWNYVRTGIEHRLCRAIARIMTPRRCPEGIARRAFGRIHSELVREALAVKADFYYGGTAGTVAAVAEAAGLAHKPYGLDLEDFHSGEHQSTAKGWLDNELGERVEGPILLPAKFLTTAGRAMADAYERKYGIRPLPINNVFPLPEQEPDFEPSSADGLRFYWFGQTIGLDKGLQTVVEAVGLAGLRAEMHLRGRPLPDFVRYLTKLQERVAPGLRITWSEAVASNLMVDMCRGHDFGLAVLPKSDVPNLQIAFLNKTLTYMLAGLALVLADTPGQVEIAEEMGEHALLYAPDDAAQLAAGLRRMADDPARLRRAKQASWQAAKRRWHWEHDEERGALLRVLAEALR